MNSEENNLYHAAKRGVHLISHNPLTAKIAAKIILAYSVAANKLLSWSNFSDAERKLALLNRYGYAHKADFLRLVLENRLRSTKLYAKQLWREEIYKERQLRHKWFDALLEMYTEIGLTVKAISAVTGEQITKGFDVYSIWDEIKSLTQERGAEVIRLIRLLQKLAENKKIETIEKKLADAEYWLTESHVNKTDKYLRDGLSLVIDLERVLFFLQPTLSQELESKSKNELKDLEEFFGSPSKLSAWRKRLKKAQNDAGANKKSARKKTFRLSKELVSIVKKNTADNLEKSQVSIIALTKEEEALIAYILDNEDHWKDVSVLNKENLSMLISVVRAVSHMVKSREAEKDFLLFSSMLPKRISSHLNKLRELISKEEVSRNEATYSRYARNEERVVLSVFEGESLEEHNAIKADKLKAVNNNPHLQCEKIEIQEISEESSILVLESIMLNAGKKNKLISEIKLLPEPKLTRREEKEVSESNQSDNIPFSDTRPEYLIKTETAIRGDSERLYAYKSMRFDSSAELKDFLSTWQGRIYDFDMEWYKNGKRLSAYDYLKNRQMYEQMGYGKEFRSEIAKLWREVFGKALISHVKQKLLFYQNRDIFNEEFDQAKEERKEDDKKISAEVSLSIPVDGILREKRDLRKIVVAL